MSENEVNTAVVEENTTVEEKVEENSQQFCSNCGAQLKEGAKFCAKCGSSTSTGEIKKLCSACGAELDTDEMFCHSCGAPVAVKTVVKKKIKRFEKKRFSIFSFIAFLLTSVVFADFISKTIEMFSNSTPSTIAWPLVGATVALGLALVSVGICWNRKSKVSVVSVILLLIGSVGAYLFGTSGMLVTTFISIFAVVISYIFLLFTDLGVMKSKGLIYTFVIIFTVINLLISLINLSVMCILALIPLTLVLCFSGKEEIKEVGKKRIWISRIVALALSAVAICVASISTFNECWTKVPTDVVGMNFEEAKQQYEDIQMVAMYEFSDEVEEDCIIEQYSSVKGKYVHPYTKISYKVSKGPGVEVPKGLEGKSEAKVKKALQDLGLKVKVTKDYHPRVKKGNVTVVKDEGYRVDEGSTITITVSKGKDTRIQIPDVIGLTESKAKSKLEKKGFKVKVKNVYKSCNAYYDQSCVVEQNKYGKAKKGTTVTIEVTRPSIKITGVRTEHNSVGGLDIDISFTNISSKTIKYITFTARFKNTFGDDVYCEISHDNTNNLQHTGPIYSGGSARPHWDAVIYNWDANQTHFSNIRVEFTDGTVHNMEYSGYWYQR